MIRSRHHRASLRQGSTLIEMIASLLSATVLLTGLASTMYIALRGTDAKTTPTAAAIEGSSALTNMLSDIEFAQEFSEQTNTAMTFCVPDRDGDSIPEVIRYAWSGTPGSSLTRQYNGGTVATLVDDVHVFQHDIPVPNANLLANADMESGTSSWQGIPNATLSSQTLVNRSGSLALYSAAVLIINNSGARQDVTSQIINGETYDIGAWMRTASLIGSNYVKVQLRVTSTGSGEQLFSTDPVNINSSSWTPVQGLVSPTWSGTLTSAYFEARGVTNIPNVYVDDAYLRVHQTYNQNVNIRLQVGTNERSLIHAGAVLHNSPF